MVKSKRQRYESYRDSIQEDCTEGRITDAEEKSILEFLDAKDPQCGIVGDGDTKSDGTLASYAYSIYRVAKLGDFDITDASEYDINKLMDDIRQGRVDDVKDEGLTSGTVRNIQSSLRKFYEYHDDLNVDKDDIILFDQNDHTVDERDVFDKEDIHALREAADHPRDRALIDLLLYTGQRLSAILNLRNKDMKPDDGVFYLNTENGDMKGAEGKRPLLYAEKAVRDWKRRHPCKDDPDAHFITHKIDGDWFETGDRLDNTSVRRLITRIAKKTDVEKPTNPHNFRHSFVTICKRDYGMDNDTIKRLIGHDASSTVMESTYSHLTDQDVIDTAQRATGIKEDEPESPLTPDVCESCGEPVPLDNAKACAACGIDFTPDSAAVKEHIEEEMWNAKGEAEGERENMTVDSFKDLYNKYPQMAVQAFIEDSDVDVNSLMDWES